MATKKIVIRGGVEINGTLGSGGTDPVLTRNPTSKEVGQIPSPTAGLSGVLQDGYVYIGNNLNVATARLIIGDIGLTNLGLATITDGVIINSKISPTAAIAYSKLALTNSIVNADINTSAAIARTKLANGTAYRILANSAAGVMSENAAITPNRLVLSNANGQLTASGITNVVAGYLDPTSPIQAQINNRLSFSSAISPVEGDLIYFTGGSWNRFAVGSAGQYLSSTGTVPTWITVPAGMPTGGSTNQYLRKNSNADFDTVWDTLTLSDVTDVTATVGQVNVLATGYYNATSPIQGQIDNKLDKSLPQNYLFVGSSSGIASQLASGPNGYVLTSVGGVPAWVNPGAGGTVTSVDGSGGTTGLTLTGGPITTSGTLTLGGTLDADNGGTGQSVYTIGDLLYASTTTVLSKLAAATSGYILTSNGAGVAPSWQANTAAIADGDKGDITVSGSGTVWTIDLNINKAWTGTHSFEAGDFRLYNPANTFYYTLLADNILANRTINLPLLGADDTLVTTAATQALSNKTGLISQWTNDAGYLTSLTGAWLLASGGTLTGTNTINQAGFDINFSGGLLSGTFAATGLKINNATNTFAYTITATTSNNVQINIPAVISNDTFILAGRSNNFSSRNSFISANTSGTGSSAGTYFTYGTINSGNGMELFSNTTAINHVAGTNGVFYLSTSGANANSGRTMVGLSSSVANTGTTSTNIAGYFSAAGATTNYALMLVGDIFLNQDTAIGGGLLSTIFKNNGLGIRNPANTFSYTIVASAIGGNRNATIPVLNGNDTFGMLGVSQNWTGAQTFTNANVLGGNGTMAVFNTTVTNLSFAGAATTLAIGGTPTSSITHAYSNNVTASGNTKTIGFGGGGVAGSITNIIIGAAAAGALGTITLRNPVVFGIAAITSGSVLADFQSTTLGVLISRVTNVAAVTTPVNGMVVYDAATDLFNFRQAGAWATLGGGGGGFYQTVQNTGSGLTQRAILNATNGLKAVDNVTKTDIRLGGTITDGASASINVEDTNWYITLNGISGPSDQGVFIISDKVSSPDWALSFDLTSGILYTLTTGTLLPGYAADYSASMTARHFVDKGYVDTHSWKTTGSTTITGNTTQTGAFLNTFALNGVTITQNAQTAGASQALYISGGTHTALTASTLAPDISIRLDRAVQFATGALANQYAMYVVADPIYSFVGASVATDVAGVAFVGAPSAGTNATITNLHAVIISSVGVITGGAVTNSYGLTVNAMTGATSNYSAQFSGGLGVRLNDINLVLGTTTGTRIGTATSQKIGLWNATPVVQPTSAIGAATFVANTSLIANDTATWGGYTAGQIVAALKLVGILA